MYTCSRNLFLFLHLCINTQPLGSSVHYYLLFGTTILARRNFGAASANRSGAIAHKVIFPRKQLNIPCLTALHIDMEYSRIATVHGEIAVVYENKFDEAVNNSTAQTMATLERVCSLCFAPCHGSPVHIHCFS